MPSLAKKVGNCGVGASKVEIYPSENGWQVILDGHNVSASVLSVSFDVGFDRLPTVKLELADCAVSAELPGAIVGPRLASEEEMTS